jgi:predicted nucleic acid-binding protein
VRVYVDSSALIKRAIAEPESDALDAALSRHVDTDAALLSSSLAWVEVSRAIRTRLNDEDLDEVNDAMEVALSGIAERPMTAEVVSLARRIGPTVLRSLDAIHLATAVLLDADVIVTYDDRLADAARHNGLAVAAPSSASMSSGDAEAHGSYSTN